MWTVIVDGNNIFQALDVSGDPTSAAAEQFLQKLERTAVMKDWEVIVVFDGRPRFLPRETGPLTVRYAAVRQTADSVIERLVYQLEDKNSVIVVTQDHSEANIVLGCGARVWSSNRLLEEME